MKKILSALILGWVFRSLGWSQDPEFSQFYANPLYLNPAYTGTTQFPTIHINFRDQWPEFSHAYISYSASFDLYVDVLNSGVGLLMMGDRAGEGIYNTFTFGGFYSYQANLGDNLAIKLGLQGSYIQKQIDYSKVFFYDQIDPVTGFFNGGNAVNPTFENIPGSNTLSMLDFSAGLMVFTRRFFGGFAGKHINEPEQAFLSGSAKLPMRLTFHGGGVLGDPDDRQGVTISPNFMYTRQAEFDQLNVGTYLKKGFLFGGAWYRYNIDYSDAVILLAGVHQGIMRIGYSYDFTIRDLQGHSGGSHELSVTINLDDLESLSHRINFSESLRCPPLF